LFSILYGLLAAASWGGGDFAGGLAARKTGAYRAAFYAEAIGLAVLLVLVAVTPQQWPDALSWALAFLAGMVGTVGIVMLYLAMAQGLMSIAAPISALLTAALPVLVSAFREGLPDLGTYLGFGIALAAVWLISQGKDGIQDIRSHLSDLRLPLLAGLGFGGYFVLMNLATREATLWPMLAARSSGLAMVGLFIALRREGLSIQRAALPAVAISGILDIGGNFFYILAGRAGRMDVAAVLSALYPAFTVILAWLLLGERLAKRQTLGVFLALSAIILLTIS
jgi:drug/metabolite transporter (DMT)-like permease